LLLSILFFFFFRFPEIEGFFNLLKFPTARLFDHKLSFARSQTLVRLITNACSFDPTLCLDFVHGFCSSGSFLQAGVNETLVAEKNGNNKWF
jgi:hypothetical protein